MLLRLCQGAVIRLWVPSLVNRSVLATEPRGPAFSALHTLGSGGRKSAESEGKVTIFGNSGVVGSRQAEQGFQFRTFGMTGEGSMEAGGVVKDPLGKGYNLTDDRYANYRGLAILKFIGFEIEELSATKSRGRFTVDKNSCQPFNVLHGGVTAYIAESIASVSAGVAADFQRVAGIELTCSHLRSVPLGSEVEVTCVPLRVGKRVQVWEVKFETSRPEKKSSESSESKPSQMVLAAVSRVTLISGLPVTPESKL